MGTWGTAIFADDDAADVRDNFLHYVAAEQSICAATDAIAEDFGASLADAEANTAFWIALAVSQWRKGWIDERVRDVAIAIIESGSDLAKWSPELAAKRQKALLVARDQLLGQPRPLKPFPKPWPVQLPDFQIGEIIGFELQTSRLAVMKVTAFRRTTSLKVSGPAVALQKWVRTSMPSAAEAASLEPLIWPIAPNQIQTFGDLVLTAPRGKQLDPKTFLRPGIVGPVKVEETNRQYTCVSTWSTFSMEDIIGSGIARWWDDPSLPAAAYPPWYKPRGASG